jgi:carboxymethylenebutenolidase
MNEAAPRIRRRALLRGLSGAACAMAASRLAGAVPRKTQVQPTAEPVQIVGVDGLSGLLMKPTASGKWPAMVVAHDERGFDPHAKDVAARLTALGFLTIAVDYLSPEGGTPDEAGAAADMMRKLSFTNTLERSRAVFAWLKQRQDCTGRIGSLGFGWGGGVATDLAVIEPGLVAAVSYYGPQSSYFLGLEYKDMKAATMLHYAGRDRAINAGIAQFEGTLRNETTAPAPEIFLYTDVDHGFADETDPRHFDKPAADLAWARSTVFLQKYLNRTS